MGRLTTVEIHQIKVKCISFRSLTREQGDFYFKESSPQLSTVVIPQYVVLHLVEGSKNPRISRLILKARGRNLEIKTHNKWRYGDEICVGKIMSQRINFYCVKGLVRRMKH